MKPQDANSGRTLNVREMLCYKTSKQRGPIKEIRIVEFMMCVICLLLILLKHLYFAVHLEVYVIVIFPTILYMVITFIDFMFIYTWWPSGWLFFSITGALYFFACVGLSFYVDDALAYTAMFTITAIVFLLDALCTLKQIRNVTPTTPSSRYMKTPARYSGEQTLKSPQEYSFEHITTGQGSRLSDGRYENERKGIHSSKRHATSSETRQDSPSTKRETNTTDEEKSTSSAEETKNEDRRSKKNRNRQSEKILARKNLQVRRSIRRMQAKREIRKKVAPSYGGTFHVSRDTVPMARSFVTPQDVPQNENYEEQDWRKSNKIVQPAMPRSPDGVALTPLRLPHSITKYRGSPRQNQNDFKSTSIMK